MDDWSMARVRGRVVAGRYRVERVIGTGGMSILVEARAMGTASGGGPERVALKFLRHAEAKRRPDVVARFLREAEAITALRSVHTVRLFEAGLLPDGEPFLAMEYLTGRDLGRVLESSGPLPLDAAAGVILEASDALAEAHAAGIVHRDLKPRNLFLAVAPDGSEVIKVLDFGVAKLWGGAALTASGVTVGSPRYMAPEQILNAKRADGRADVWGLGVVLYELLAGTPPFDGRSEVDVYKQILGAPVPPLRALRPVIPESIEQVIGRCLEKREDARFQTVAELAGALAPFALERAKPALLAAASHGPPLPPEGALETEDSLAETAAGAPPPAKRGGWLASLASFISRGRTG